MKRSKRAQIGPVILLNAHGCDVRPLSTRVNTKINTKSLH